MSNTTVDQFFKLHHNDRPLLLGNIWDVNSAKMFEALGFTAIGTSSSAIAKTFGFEDGENIPFDTLLQISARVVEAVKIPFSVDIEGGFSRTAKGISENIKRLHDAGVAGINLEDSIPGVNRVLRSVDDFQRLLTEVTATISRDNMKLFVNVRTDGFLLGMKTALAETLTRAKAYEGSGADGLFVPCVTQQSDIREVVEHTRLPINVMCMPDLPGFEALQSLGVKRISMGPFVSNFIHKKTEEIIQTIVQENSFGCLFR